MKNIIFLFAVLLIAESSFSQQMNTKPELPKQDYLKKSKRQRITSGFLLGGGFLCASVGVQLGGKSVSGFSQVAGGVMIISGLAAMGTSIPLFIISFVTKSKGMRMSFNNQAVPQVINSSLVYKIIPSINFKINL